MFVGPKNFPKSGQQDRRDMPSDFHMVSPERHCPWREKFAAAPFENGCALHTNNNARIFRLRALFPDWRSV
jgi:hypothetical protein